MTALDQQVVLITGAGRGIGRETALTFARQGSAVVVNDIHAESAQATVEAITEKGGRALAIAADVADHGAVEALFRQAESCFGPVTTLINNAGYVPFMPFADYTAEIWHKTLRVNLDGIFHCAQVAAGSMEHAGGGVIVNVASVHALATLPGTTAYAAAKGGVVSLTRSLALELGPKGIRVNCICPGAIETDALRAYFDSMPVEKREKEQAYLLSWHPLGRIGQPEDVANLIQFLCSDQSAFIHGAEIVIDGGCLARLF